MMILITSAVIACTQQATYQTLAKAFRCNPHSANADNPLGDGFSSSLDRVDRMLAPDGTIPSASGLATGYFAATEHEYCVFATVRLCRLRSCVCPAPNLRTTPTPRRPSRLPRTTGSTRGWPSNGGAIRTAGSTGGESPLTGAARHRRVRTRETESRWHDCVPGRQLPQAPRVRPAPTASPHDHAPWPEVIASVPQPQCAPNDRASGDSSEAAA